MILLNWGSALSELWNWIWCPQGFSSFVLFVLHPLRCRIVRVNQELFIFLHGINWSYSIVGYVWDAFGVGVFYAVRALYVAVCYFTSFPLRNVIGYFMFFDFICFLCWYRDQSCLQRIITRIPNCACWIPEVFRFVIFFSMRSRVTYHLWTVHMLSPYTHDVLCVVLLVPCSCVDATLCVVVTGRGACMAGERQSTDQAPDTCGWGAICGVSRASVRVSFVWGYEDVSSFCNWKPPNK